MPFSCNIMPTQGTENEGGENKRIEYGWFVTQLVARLHNEFNFQMVIAGKTGVGKSYLAIKIGESLTKAFTEHIKYCNKCRLKTIKSICPRCKALFDACEDCKLKLTSGEIPIIPFGIDQIIFDPSEFFNQLPMLPSGSWTVWDESGVSLDAHRWMSSIHRCFGYVAETFRFKQIQTIFALPDLSMLYVNARRVTVCFVRCYKRGTGKVYLLKCLPSYTDVVTFNGVNSLNDLYKHDNPVEIPSYNFTTDVFEKDLASIEPTGKRQTDLIEFEDHQKLEVTPEHRLFVMDDGKICEKKVSEIKEEDRVISWEK